MEMDKEEVYCGRCGEVISNPSFATFCRVGLCQNLVCSSCHHIGLLNCLECYQSTNVHEKDESDCD